MSGLVFCIAEVTEAVAPSPSDSVAVLDDLLARRAAVVNVMNRVFGVGVGVIRVNLRYRTTSAFGESSATLPLRPTSCSGMGVPSHTTQ